MRGYFKRMLTPRTAIIDNPLQHYREKTLAMIFLSTVVIGAIVYGVKLYEAIQVRSLHWGGLISLVYIGFLCISLIPKIPFKLRVVVGMLYLYGFGLTSILRYGPSGETLAWFLCLSIFSVLYIGRRVGIVATSLNFASLLLVGFGQENGWFSLSSITRTQQPRFFPFWINPALLYFLAGMVTVVVINAIIENLNQTLRVAGISNQALIEEHDQLEKRSRDLERREAQIRTATQISRTISAQLDPEKLFSQVVELILERFDLYYVGIFLLDPGGEFAVLKAGTGEAGKAMLEAGHKLPVAGTSMIGWAVSRQQARIALDVGEDAVRFENPNLPYTRSELAIPMISGSQVLGAITIQSKLPNAFDENDIVILEGIADSLAIAYENAILFKQIRSNLEEIHKLNQRYLADEWMDVVSTKGDVSYSFKNKNYETIREESLETIEKPLILRDQVMGQIILEGDSCSLDSEDETFIESVATQAVLALENIRLMESTQRSAHHNRVVAELSHKVWESTDLDTILRTTLFELAEALQASNGLIRLEIPQESDPSLPIRS